MTSDKSGRMLTVVFYGLSPFYRVLDTYTHMVGEKCRIIFKWTTDVGQKCCVHFPKREARVFCSKILILNRTEFWVEDKMICAIWFEMSGNTFLNSCLSTK